MVANTALSWASQVSDNLTLFRSAADAEFERSLLDAFCEDEGFAFAKLDEVEWQLIQRGVTALIAVSCSLLDPQSSTAVVGV